MRKVEHRPCKCLRTVYWTVDSYGYRAICESITGECYSFKFQSEFSVVPRNICLIVRARNDGNPRTMNFLTSPELTTAMTFAGSMEFNPMTDSIVTPSGKEFKFEPPSGESLPVRGFDSGIWVYNLSNVR